MHLHIIGICGTFMGGLAQLAVSLGHRVTGCDAQVYPPMSDQLRTAGIELIEGFEADQLALKPDVWVVGNVARRGLPIVEALLNAKAPMVSGPAWLADALLRHRRLAAVAGTHGKTTTSTLLAYLLEAGGQQPGFLIGGVPENFGCSARVGDGCGPFVIEADEYDTAFFDKRSKFLHYRADVAVLNNLEFDHADIFPNVEAIETQFHHWIRTLPASGSLVVNQDEASLTRVLARGTWTPVQFFSRGQPEGLNLGSCQPAAPASGELGEFDVFEVFRGRESIGIVQSPLWGDHNRLNLLAAIAVAEWLGVPAEASIEAMPHFAGIKRRMQLRGEAQGIRVYDDFAHHPTAIATTLQGLRRQIGPNRRLLAILEPRSNTMKMGVMRAALPQALEAADCVFGFEGGLDWSLAETLRPLGDRAKTAADLSALIDAIVAEARPGDQLIVMSNGAFGGIHGRLLEALSQSPSQAAGGVSAPLGEVPAATHSVQGR